MQFGRRCPPDWTFKTPTRMPRGLYNEGKRDDHVLGRWPMPRGPIHVLPQESGGWTLKSEESDVEAFTIPPRKPDGRDAESRAEETESSLRGSVMQIARIWAGYIGAS